MIELDNLQRALVKSIKTIKENIYKSLKAKGRYATGKTQKAIHEAIDGLNAKILGPAYIEALEIGRGPTKPGAAAGNPPLVESIKEWMAAKNIKGSAWAIANKIHKEGYKGKSGAITDGLVNAPEEVVREIKLAAGLDVRAHIKNILK